MRVALNPEIISSLRELPVSLKLNNKSNFSSPIKSSGYVIDPTKYQGEIKDVDLNLREIKALLLMMVKGDSNFISKLIKPNSSNFVNTLV